MGKNQRKYYLILAAMLTVLISWEYLKPKETDWTVTLSKRDKIPYGTYILYNTLKDVFPDKVIEDKKVTLYEYRKENKEEPKNFIFFRKSFDPDRLELESMIEMLKEGNDFFISALKFSKIFTDTLNITIYDNIFSGDDSIGINFNNPNISSDKDYILRKGFGLNYFSYFNKDSIVILGERDKAFPNFIKKQFGKGTLYINTQPLAFTNFHMLVDNNSDYVYKALSHMPVRDVVWDEYGKFVEENEDSALRYIFKNKSLYAGYIMLILSFVVYMLFTAKRTQRIVPVIEPLKNTTVEFANTIGRLYLHGKNHKDIAMKKFNYFLENLRTNYFINIDLDNDIDFNQISQKTAVDVETMEKIFKIFKKINASNSITDEQLMQFSNAVEKFYTQTKIK